MSRKCLTCGFLFENFVLLSSWVCKGNFVCFLGFGCFVLNDNWVYGQLSVIGSECAFWVQFGWFFNNVLEIKLEKYLGDRVPADCPHIMVFFSIL
jgi:hypothetical protein